MTTVAARLAAVRRDVAEAIEACGRIDQVTIVAVSKTMPAQRILEAYEAGQRIFGENRVQEGAAKRAVVEPSTADAIWHLVGTLQSNKVGPAVQAFHLIESVDSTRLARRIGDRAGLSNRTVPILLEVNVAGETSKSGFTVEALLAGIDEIATCHYLDLRGLMTVAPLANDPEDVRWVFRRLRELRDDLRDRYALQGFEQLSMGMSADFRVAIAEGATSVRIGRAIFGPRE